jgi:ABC-type multidrug transport system ATPase subunit
MDGVVAHDNRFLGNRIGIYLDNSPWSVDVYDYFDRNVLAYNDIGVAFLPAVKRNVFRDNTFLENQEQVAVLGSGDFGGNDFTVEGRGNFWSDYKGYDLDGDGLGDVPYKAESLFENLMDREKKLRLFLYGPAQQAVELAARAMPSIKPRPKVQDAAPLMDPTPLEASPLPARSGRPLAVLAAALLFGTLAGLQRVRRPDGDVAECGEAAAEPVPAGEAGEPVIRVRSLVKRFGKFTAVDRLDFDVARGEAVALWGENGAGKTTAIKCVLGLLRSEGEIRVAGCNLRSDGKGVRRALGYVAQELALHDDLGTLETLKFYARLKKVPVSRSQAVLADVQMEAHAHKKIGELSGGMKQRIALAIALLADPPVLVLDEMTSNLDANSRGGLLGLLERQRGRGKTILFTSHRLDEVQALADRVLVMKDGKLANDCTPVELPEVLGLRSRLELLFPEADRERAHDVLTAGGFETHRNGGPCIRVRVRPADKLEVLRCLEEAGLYLTDFEMETEAVPKEGE